MELIFYIYTCVFLENIDTIIFTWAGKFRDERNSLPLRTLNEAYFSIECS